MTEKDCLDNITKFCNNDLNKHGWLIFNDHNVTLEKTRLLYDYEKKANLPLPTYLDFENVRIDFIGIKIINTIYKWIDICTIVIKHDRVPSDWDEIGRFRTDNYLVFCLNNGEVLQVKLDKIDHLSNLLGHFIELYKLGVSK